MGLRVGGQNAWLSFPPGKEMHGLIGKDLTVGLGPRSIAALIAVMALAALLAGPAARSAEAAAWPWGYVSAANGSDAGNDCTDQYAPCATIQHAIDEAGPNQFGAIPSINVAPGIYSEQLTIDTPVTLRGPNSRLEDRDPEAVIEGGAGTAISPEASNITITGFTISADDAGTPIRTTGPDVDRLTISSNIIEGDASSGVWLGAGGAETKINLNQIEGDEYGIRLGPADYSELSVWYNRLRGPVGSDGVFAGPGTSIDGFWFEGNEFATSNLEASITNGWIQANEIDPPAGSVGLRASLTETHLRENSFRGEGEASCLQLLGKHPELDPSRQVHIGQNEFVGCEPYAVQLGPEVASVTATMNTFPETYDGIVTDDSSPWDVTGRRITVFGNRFVGTEHLGVYNAVGGELNARNNWWGCNGGPGSVGCDKVSGGVDAFPNVILTAEALEAGKDPWNAARIDTLDPGEKAAISADLRDGDGGEALNVSLISEDPVFFSSPKGDLLWVSSFWQNAHAGNLFTAGSQPGPAEVVVTMDNERVEVPLTINGKSPAASVAPSPLPPRGRPQIRIRRGTLDLSRRNAVIGTIGCAQSACRVDRRSAALRVGRVRFGVKLKMPAEIAAESGGQIRAIMPVRAARRLSRQGAGTLIVAVKMTDAHGGAASTTRRIKVAWTG